MDQYSKRRNRCKINWRVGEVFRAVDQVLLNVRRILLFSARTIRNGHVNYPDMRSLGTTRITPLVVP